MSRTFIVLFCCENARKTVVKCYGNPGRDESSALPKVCYPLSAKFGFVYTRNETKHLLFLFKHVQMEGLADPFKKI